MKNEINTKDSENQNDWAFDIKEIPIHITQSKSGANGYYCMGCNKEMQAIKFKNPKHQSYFRHHASNIDKDTVECIYSSRVYRERLAEHILRRLKELKLPDLYKFPPKGTIGSPILLQEKTTIHAAKVVSQLSFYEDEEGTIKWGKNPEIEDRYLLIRPDVTFFDEEDKPILFVEFVITHKLDDEKKIKLRRIGINTVQIIIPKVPEEEIEKILKSVTKVKWVYNEIESNTSYISVSKGNPKGIPFIDEEQRRLFEESYSCRTAQIGNLIRSIRRCLESQSYKRTENQFEREISRIKKASDGVRQRLDEMARSSENEIFTEFESEESTIEETGRALSTKEKESLEYYSDVERRFYSKSSDLRKEQEDTREQISAKYGIRNTAEGIREDHNDRTNTIREEEKNIAREESYLLDRERADREKEIKHFQFIEQLDFEEQSRHRAKIDKLSREIENIGRRIDSLSTEFEQKGTKLQEDHTQLENTVRERIDNRKRENQYRISVFRTGTIQLMDGKNASGIELSDRIKKLSEARRFLYHWEEEKCNDERLRVAIECIRKGDYKKWD